MSLPMSICSFPLESELYTCLTMYFTEKVQPLTTHPHEGVRIMLLKWNTC